MRITKGQIRRIHAILQHRGLMDMKQELIFDYTNRRTKHCSDMTAGEGIQMIKGLTEKQQEHPPCPPQGGMPTPKPGDAQRKRILSICYQMPVELGFTVFDEKRGRRIVNMLRLNEFLNGPKSIFKKDLNRHTPMELSRVIIQFENMLSGYTKRETSNQ